MELPASIDPMMSVNVAIASLPSKRVTLLTSSILHAPAPTTNPIWPHQAAKANCDWIAKAVSRNSSRGCTPGPSMSLSPQSRLCHLPQVAACGSIRMSSCMPWWPGRTLGYVTPRFPGRRFASNHGRAKIQALRRYLFRHRNRPPPFHGRPRSNPSSPERPSRIQHSRRNVSNYLFW